MRACLAALGLLGASVALATPDTPCRQPAQICPEPVPGSLPLIDNGHPARILVDADDHPAVLLAADSLRRDLSRLSGRDAAPLTDAVAGDTPVAILAGSLDRSPRLRRLLDRLQLDLTGLEGRWEGYLLQVVEAPEPGVARALLIVGADRRGTVFGIYELARRLGVSPWAWWADVPLPRIEQAHVAPGPWIDAPAVRYRGIFLNDEDPALGGWAKATFGGPNHRFYERVFELILRLKGNYLWPAMWGRAFYDDDPQNAELAERMGVVIATSHHEPMMRAHVEWARYGQGPWDYRHNDERLRQFWRKGIARLEGREAVVTLGMRGDGDEPMSEDTAIDLLQRIVADQRHIIAGVSGRPAAETPQVWALYKEVQDYYDRGMRVPDDVTLLFADDNWGNIRRLPQPGAQRPGGYGVYYHFDYVGGPRNYKWLNTVQLERTWEQMQQAWAHGVDRIWIVNVGDLKPMELPISLFLDLAWDPDRFPPQRLQDYPRSWAAEQFGAELGAEIGPLLSRYTQYNARRKPELLDERQFSLQAFDDADRVLQQWQSLAEQVERLRPRISPDARDAWYQLVEYPVLASANLSALYVAVARNRLYAEQGRASANVHADLARSLFARDAELQRVYEQELAGGKWMHMMSQTRIGYTRWQQPERNVLPALTQVDVRDAAAMGVALPGDVRGWPQVAERATLALHPDEPTELVVYNRGRAPFEVSLQADQPWLRITPAQATVTLDQPIRLQVDPALLPDPVRPAQLRIRGSDGTELSVSLSVDAPESAPTTPSFVERDGYIAIEAGEYSQAVANAGAQWLTIPGLGRSGAGVTSWPPALPPTAADATGDWLEYPLQVAADGEVELRLLLSPSLPVLGEAGLRLAVAFDNQPPHVLQLRLDPTPGHPDFQAWERAVADSVAVLSSTHHLSAGSHRLRIWRIDPGVVLQRIELWRGPVPPSFLGPPATPLSGVH